ncbi:Retrovirus-related Pol polyprotein from transposon [Smittium culicis]|uniref:Retrovirus-related Pol polyprotein from transposon n=1 Tax=Smittium culicis TaxID=133412 RepID=A0A1R1XYA2_9FUNG|nr:Retrovirus-related Pol polyprotein from transposon [Smittium culicis]
MTDKNFVWDQNKSENKSSTDILSFSKENCQPISFEGLPEKFSGTSGSNSVSIWCRNFSRLTKLKGWSKEVAVTVFKTWFVRSAAEWLYSLETGTPESDNWTLKKWIQELETRFPQLNHGYEFKKSSTRQLAELVPTTNEPIKSFNLRFLSLLNEIPDSLYTQGSIRVIYLETLVKIDKDIAWSVIDTSNIDNMDVKEIMKAVEQKDQLKRSFNYAPKEAISKTSDKITEDKSNHALIAAKRIRVDDLLDNNFDKVATAIPRRGIVKKVHPPVTKTKKKSKTSTNSALPERILDMNVPVSIKELFVIKPKAIDNLIYTLKNIKKSNINKEILLAKGENLNNEVSDDSEGYDEPINARRSKNHTCSYVLFQVLSSFAVPILLGRDVCHLLKSKANYDEETFSFSHKNREIRLQLYSKNALSTQLGLESISEITEDEYETEISESDKDDSGLYFDVIKSDLSGCGSPTGEIFHSEFSIAQAISENKLESKFDGPEELESDLEIIEIEPSNIRVEEKIEELCNNLSEIQENTKIELKKMLIKYKDTFPLTNLGINGIKQFEYKLELPEDSKPIIKRLRRYSEKEKLILRSHIDEMINFGIISPSDSEWCFPVVLVPKSTGELRFCVNFKQLNDLTKKDRFPLPRIDDCLESLRNKFFSRN